MENDTKDKKMLKIEKLSAGYADTQVLWDINLSVEKNETVALIGSNGAGKSTLLETVIGLVKPISGLIELENKPVYSDSASISIPTRERVKNGMSLVPQGRHLFPNMTVEENISLGAFLQNNRKTLKKELEKVYELFPRVYERKNHPAGKLSGGEQQMVAIARALMSKPKLLMIDELSLGLAPVIVDILIEIIYDISKTGTSLLVVEQDVQVALSVAKRAYVLETGKVVMQGKSKDLLDDPQIQSAYLGI